MSAETSDRTHALITSGLDWHALTSGAAEHGVAALVYSQLLAHFGELLPAELRAQMKKKVEETAQRNLYLTAEMFQLANRFRAAEIFAVPYKGPLLATQAYGNLAMRQFADLDFAIRQRDLPRAATLLAANGYNSVFGATSAEEGTHPTHSEYQFVRPAGNVIVEMQTEVTLRYFPRKLDFDALEKRLTSVALAGGETLSFSPEDTLILLSVHGAKHFWERLMWIADISELSQAAPGIDWTAAFSRAKEMGVSRMLNLALYLAHQMLEAPLPDDVLERVLRDPVARKLGNGICEGFSMTAQANLPIFARFRFRVASRDSFSAGLRFAMRLATSPTEPDRADVPLPQSMSGMRRWLRPVLLMKRHGIRRPKSSERR
jgi:putative nucleotidyltransferase-like protein